jgi:hypothetical protein
MRALGGGESETKERWKGSWDARDRRAGNRLGRRPAGLRVEKGRKGGPVGLEQGRGERVGRFCLYPFLNSFFKL